MTIRRSAAPVDGRPLHRVGLLAAALLLVGCFDPSTAGVDAETDADGSTSSPGTTTSVDTETTDPTTGSPSTTDGPSTTDPGPSTGTTAPTSATTASDSAETTTAEPTSDGSSSDGETVGSGSTETGSQNDLPPTVALLANGVAGPATINRAERLRLEANATDDGSIDRVEFFRGDDLIATDTESPYETDVLLTSIDSGLLTFTARAFDDAGQEALSDLDATVSIIGGSTIVSEENIFQTGGLIVMPGGGAVVYDDGITIVAPVSTADFAVSGLAAVRYSDDFSSASWQRSVPAALVDGEFQYLPMGRPALSADRNTLLIAGMPLGTDGSIDDDVSIFGLDAATGDGFTSFDITNVAEVEYLPIAGMTVGPMGNVFLAGPDDSISKYAPNNGALMWESSSAGGFNFSTGGLYRISTGPDGDVVTDGSSCTQDTCTLTTSLINGFDGVELWSESISSNASQSEIGIGASTQLASGDVVTAFNPPLSAGGGIVLTTRNENGTTTDEVPLFGPEEFSVTDLTQDAQGNIVIVGNMGTEQSPRGFATRIEPGGAVLWFEQLSFGLNNDRALSLTLAPDGRVIVVGFSDFDPGFFVFTGSVWATQLDL